MPKSQSDSHAVYTAQHDNEDTSHHIQNFNHSHLQCNSDWFYNSFLVTEALVYFYILHSHSQIICNMD